MSLKSSVWMAGFVALTGILVGCQSQPPAPLPTPSLEASTPASPSPKAVPLSPGTQSPAKTPQDSNTQPTDNSASPAPDTPEATRTVEKCKVSMARVKDPNPPLNVRSSPNTDSSNNIVGKLPNGAFVSVVEEQPDWFRISDPAGWIAKSRTESNCNVKVERIQFGRGQNSAKISDRFIGAGSHEYRLNLAKGQRITLSSTGKVFPLLLDPNGKALNRDETATSWTGELPATGDYTLMMESNYKGYAYAFTVKVQ